MPISLAHNNYGKSQIRLLKLRRQPDRHDIKDLTLDIRFEGDFESCYLYGDNTRILPTDTIKNTAYAFAKLYSIEHIEEFGRTLAEHFLTDNPQISKVRVKIAENVWNRVPYGAKPHASTFMAAGGQQRTATITATREGVSIQAGIENLDLMRTAGAGFENYIHDPFTTLPEMEERVLTTTAKVEWTYSQNDIPFGAYWHGACEALIQTFIEHESKSAQHTLYAMGNAVLERYEEISEISIAMPAKHCVLVDLSPFGLDNNNEVFVPAEEPYATIEATVRREEGEEADELM